MGQYQQWLYYQEVDRRLRTELEALEIELAQIQEQLCRLEQMIPPADNIILRALAANFERHPLPSNQVLEGPSKDTSSIPDTATASSSETISPALYGWGRLPNFGPQDMQEPLFQPENAVPLTPHPEMALLPEDMMAFFDEHDSTEPQIKLPWWFSKTNASTSGASRTRPIDKESMRTNHQIERWRERWGRPTSIEQPSENSEDSPHE